MCKTNIFKLERERGRERKRERGRERKKGEGKRGRKDGV